jgi:hypothetical protein
MSIWINRLLVLVFINFMASANAEDITALVAGGNSFQLTTPEKALFTEASDRFTKYEIPRNIEINSVHWLDNETLVLSSRKYPGWEARPDEMSRVISYNVKTGEITDSGYRGVLICINHLGDMLLAQSDKESGRAVTFKEYRWLAGKWGQPLEPINYFSNSFIPKYLCRFSPFGDSIYATPIEQQPLGFAMVTPLMPAHGVIEDTVVKTFDQIEDSVHLIKPDGQRIFLSNSRLSRFNFVYQPWDETYFELKTAPAEARNFSPDGSIRRHKVPKLFLFWRLAISSSIAPFPSKKGVVWDLQQRTGYWRKQGIFLETDRQLLRIEEGEPSGDIITSFDGCKIFAEVVRGDPSRSALKKYTRLVIDLCMEKIN